MFRYRIITLICFRSHSNIESIEMNYTRQILITFNLPAIRDLRRRDHKIVDCAE